MTRYRVVRWQEGKAPRSFKTIYKDGSMEKALRALDNDMIMNSGNKRSFTREPIVYTWKVQMHKGRIKGWVTVMEKTNG